MILGELGSMMVAPDADVQFLQQLQQVIVSKIKRQTQQAIQGGGPPGAGGPMPGGRGSTAMGLGGAAQQMAGPQGMQAGPGGPGTAGPGGMPNADEFRRVVGATNG